MEEIRNILRVTHILNNDELRYLLYLLCNMYGIDEKIDLEINKKIKHMMAYDLEKEVIYINWDKISSEIDRTKITSTNYMLLFALIHEIGHVLQKKRIKTISDYVSYVYSICFNYIDLPSNTLVSKLKKAIYFESHDLFPSEINADVMSHIKMLEILKDFDEGFYEIYKYLLRDRLFRLHSNTNFCEFCSSVLQLKPYDVDYSLEERLIFGLPIENIPVKEQDILKLIK